MQARARLGQSYRINDADLAARKFPAGSDQQLKGTQ
jgi:hypothetical protein